MSELSERYQTVSDTLRGYWGARFPRVRPRRVEDTERREDSLAQDLGRFLLNSGYQVRNEWAYRLWNLAVALPLFVFILPLFAVVALAVLAVQGRPILYSGDRLGKDRRIFRILKFRTLVDGAAEATESGVLPKRSNLETPLGDFLRASRLDELPQLLNVLRGDMNLIGPRPVRPEIARVLSATVADYDKRFQVKPGLFGYTQVLMTHGAPKQLRGRLNALLTRRPAHIWKEPFVLGYMFWAVMSNAARGALGLLGEAIRRGARPERRREPRKRPRFTTVSTVVSGRSAACGRLCDINDEAFTFWSAGELEGQVHTFALRRDFPGGRRPRLALCTGVARHRLANGADLRSGVPDGGFKKYIVYYRPISDFQTYRIDKYFLENAIWNG